MSEYEDANAILQAIDQMLPCLQEQCDCKTLFEMANDIKKMIDRIPNEWNNNNIETVNYYTRSLAEEMDDIMELLKRACVDSS